MCRSVRFWVILVLAALGVVSQATGADRESIQREFERMATNYSHFSRTVIIRNRELWGTRLFGADKDVSSTAAEQQLRLVAALKVLSVHRDHLEALLKHADPNVRTLALGAIYQREDGRDLALIASLLGDAARTFPDFHDATSSGGGRDMGDLQTEQTVSHVVQAMLHPYLSAASFPVPYDFPSRGGVPIPPDYAERFRSAFQKYWEPRQGRERCVSWFQVKLARATRQTSPEQAKYKQDVQLVLSKIDALPPAERAWTLLFNYGHTYPESTISETKVIEDALKSIGPDRLMAFLQHQAQLDDPDLQFDDDDDNPRNDRFYSMAVLILKNARLLLKPSDAQAVLECASQRAVQRPDGKWIAAIAPAPPGLPVTKVRIGVFEASTGKLRWEITEERSEGSYVVGVATAFTPNSRRLYTAAGKRIAVWELQ